MHVYKWPINCTRTCEVLEGVLRLAAFDGFVAAVQFRPGFLEDHRPQLLVGGSAVCFHI